MIPSIAREDWNELIQMLRMIEKDVCSLDDENDSASKIASCRQTLKSFHTTAAMLDLQDIEQAGLGLEACLEQRIAKASSPDCIYSFGFALNALMEDMKKAADGKIDRFNTAEILKLLDMEGAGREESEGRDMEESLSDEKAIEMILEQSTAVGDIDFSRLEHIVKNLGGRLVVDMDGKRPSFELKFDAQPAMVEQIMTLLSLSDPSVTLAPELSQLDQRWERILGTVKEFMLALSYGDVKRSQEILLQLAEQQHQAGLYKEIGMLARELHDSLKSFATTLDPSLMEIVQDRLPDSGSRLEHILELTERSANTTLDHVEALQKRSQADQGKIAQLRDALETLKALGEQAQRRLTLSRSITEELDSSMRQTNEDLITILTAQDYQDLTGQIIQKIIKLLKDLEKKLVNVIRVFGVKAEGIKKIEDAELYGPAHKEKEGALQSQDDVDTLLADFGF